METVVDLLLVATTLVGIALCVLGVHTYRTWDEPGALSFSGFAIVLGLGAVGSGSVALVTATLFDEGGTVVWAAISNVSILVAAVLWLVFSLRYTGRGRWLRRHRILLLFVPIAPAVLSNVLVRSTDSPSDLLVMLVWIFTVLAFVYVLGLFFIGSYLHIRAARIYEHIPLGQGAAFVVTAVVIPAVYLLTLVFTDQFGDLVGVGVFFSGFAVPFVALGVAIVRYDTFVSTPAAGSIGKREIARQMDDLAIVADHRERVIDVNRATVETLGVSRTEPLDEPVATLLGLTIDEVRASDELSLHTTTGHRQFDTQVSEVRDQHDRRLGSIVTLHDVTQREIREQRLQVLNRILRHNLRNKLTVVRGNAEAIELVEGTDQSPTPGELSNRIQEAVDDLLQLTERARNVERLMHESRSDSRPFSLDTVVRDTVEDVTGSSPELSVEITIEEDRTVFADEQLFGYVLRNVVENAIEHNDTERPSVSVTVSIRPSESHTVVIEVADNGPGIPDSELDAIRQGEETALDHASGLGLWATSWGVRQLGGELTFGENDPRGTVVRIELPSAIFEGAEVSVGDVERR